MPSSGSPLKPAAAKQEKKVQVVRGLRRRALWKKWACTVELLNREYYRYLGLHEDMTFATLTRGAAESGREVATLSARSVLLEMKAGAVRAFRRWVEQLADKVAAITELRRREHDALAKRVRFG